MTNYPLIYWTFYLIVSIATVLQFTVILSSKYCSVLNKPCQKMNILEQGEVQHLSEGLGLLGTRREATDLVVGATL